MKKKSKVKFYCYRDTFMWSFKISDNRQGGRSRKETSGWRSFLFRPIKPFYRISGNPNWNWSRLVRTRYSKANLSQNDVHCILGKVCIVYREYESCCVTCFSYFPFMSPSQTKHVSACLRNPMKSNEQQALSAVSWSHSTPSLYTSVGYKASTSTKQYGGE